MCDRKELSRTGTFRAVVQAGATATPYVRAGAGRPVLILREPGGHPVWGHLVAAVAERFRIITPEIPPSQPGFERWLRHFLDGLGLSDVRIVADQTLAAPAIGFAILEADRVERLVVISPTGPAIPGSIADGGHPILFLRDDRPPADVVTAVVRFLTDGDPVIEKAS